MNYSHSDFGTSCVSSNMTSSLQEPFWKYCSLPSLRVWSKTIQACRLGTWVCVEVGAGSSLRSEPMHTRIAALAPWGEVMMVESISLAVSLGPASVAPRLWRVHIWAHAAYGVKSDTSSL